MGIFRSLRNNPVVDFVISLGAIFFLSILAWGSFIVSAPVATLAAAALYFGGLGYLLQHISGMNWWLAVGFLYGAYYVILLFVLFQDDPIRLVKQMFMRREREPRNCEASSLLSDDKGMN